MFRVSSKETTVVTKCKYNIILLRASYHNPGCCCSGRPFLRHFYDFMAITCNGLISRYSAFIHSGWYLRTDSITALSGCLLPLSFGWNLALYSWFLLAWKWTYKFLLIKTIFNRLNAIKTKPAAPTRITWINMSRFHPNKVFSVRANRTID